MSNGSTNESFIDPLIAQAEFSTFVNSSIDVDFSQTYTHLSSVSDILDEYNAKSLINEINETNIYNSNLEMLANAVSAHAEIKSGSPADDGSCYFDVNSNELSVDDSNENSEVNFLRCSICNYRCIRQENMDIHLASHNESKCYVCCLCEQQYNTDKELAKHMHIHWNAQQHCCTTCEFKSFTMDELKKHNISHKVDEPFACSYCEFRCSESIEIEKHSRTHINVKMFSVRKNNEPDISTNKSKRQYIPPKPEEKVFTCWICDYACACNSHLKIHLRVHTGEKPFTCSQCSYKSVIRGNLKRHQLIHSGEKPFKCKLCDYRCGENGHLKKHMMIHAGVKPFACSLCDYKSTRSANLRRHLLLTHPGQTPENIQPKKSKNFEGICL